MLGSLGLGASGSVITCMHACTHIIKLNDPFKMIIMYSRNNKKN